MIHPIELESYQILRSRIDLEALGYGPLSQAVVARVIHSSADLELGHTMHVKDEDATAGLKAIQGGEPIICDVEMVSHGITGVETHCFLSKVKDLKTEPGLTRSAAGMRMAANTFPEGGIWVVGCAPTALFEIINLVEQKAIAPTLVVGMPVGFVGATESKQTLRESGITAISNAGEKGGSAMAAAVVNALVRIANAEVSQ